MRDSFVFDTYALIEILNKNPNYEKFLDKGIIVNEFIFAEYCYTLFKNKVKNAEKYIEEIKPAIVSVSPELIKDAMSFRLDNKKKKMSMTDCISYLMAKEFDIEFLTGDKEFEKLEKVRFVK